MIAPRPRCASLGYGPGLAVRVLLLPADIATAQQARPDAALRALFQQAIRRVDSFDDRCDADV